MKSFKLKKQHYINLELLLKDIGLVNEAGTEAYPSSSFMGPETEKKMKKALQAEFKKLNPNSPKKSGDFAINTYMLNLSPSVVEGIKEGYVLVERENDE